MGKIVWIGTAMLLLAPVQETVGSVNSMATRYIRMALALPSTLQDYPKGKYRLPRRAIEDHLARTAVAMLRANEMEIEPEAEAQLKIIAANAAERLTKDERGDEDQVKEAARQIKRLIAQTIADSDGEKVLLKDLRRAMTRLCPCYPIC